MANQTDTIWTPELTARLKRLRRDGLTFTECAAVMGLTRCQAGAKVWRLNRRKPKRAPQIRIPNRHDDARYIERWADRKARVARERSGAVA